MGPPGPRSPVSRPWAIPALADWAVRRHPQSHGGAEGGEADTSAGWAHRTLVLRGSISGWWLTYPHQWMMTGWFIVENTIKIWMMTGKYCLVVEPPSPLKNDGLRKYGRMTSHI